MANRSTDERLHELEAKISFLASNDYRRTMQLGELQSDVYALQDTVRFWETVALLFLTVAVTQWIIKHWSESDAA